MTTIRIGDDVVNLTLLNDISQRTGGQAYHVEDIATLPELMLRDTSAAMAQPPAAGQRLSPDLQQGKSGAARHQVELPPLHGYAYARAKPRADVLVYVPGRADREPILAAWQYGLGRVAAFTADPSNDAEAWPGWDAYAKFWSQIMRWTMREQTPWDYAITAGRRDGKTKIMVTAFDPRQSGVLFARLHLSETSTEDLTLAPIAPRQFETELPAVPGGDTRSPFCAAAVATR